jgi:hypothetical protein
LLVHIEQAAVDKSHPPVMAWKGFKNSGVKNKDAKNLLASEEGVVQSRVVIRA